MDRSKNAFDSKSISLLHVNSYDSLQLHACMEMKTDLGFNLGITSR